MLQLLTADGPDPEHAEALMLYGRLVGSWDISNRYRFADGVWRTAEGEWHFGWTLGGRVVQDVLHCPDFQGRFPGTTVRMYDGLTLQTMAVALSDETFRAAAAVCDDPIRRTIPPTHSQVFSQLVTLGYSQTVHLCC